MKEKLWEPSAERKAKTNMTGFIQQVNQKYQQHIMSYHELYEWSIQEAPAFWATMWEFGGIKASRTYDQVVENFDNMMAARWFTGAELNFAENLLRCRDDKTALIFKGETQEPVRLTYGMLYDRVARLAKSLRTMGVTAGDRVAGFMPNMAETVIAMLAATSIGAIWSSCSPDFGIKGVLDRFGQIQPKVLFTANGYYYNDKAFDSLERVAGILQEIPGIEKVVVVPYTEKEPDIRRVAKSVLFDDFLADEDGLEIEFTQVPFNHPLYIMYSSGERGTSLQCPVSFDAHLFLERPGSSQI